MMKGVFISFVLLLSCCGIFAANQVKVNLQCPEGWTQIGFGCYWLITHVMPWKSAERLCKSYGGRLAVGNDYFENEGLGEIADGLGVKKYWIGAQRLDTQSADKVTLNRDGGEDITIDVGRWYQYQPEFDSGKCIYVMQDEDGKHKWKFEHCEMKVASLCERSVCPEDTFMCTNGKCVSKKATCDGEDDCGDSSDEKECSQRFSYSWNNQQGGIIHPRNGNYSNDESYTWFIEVPVGYNIEFKVHSLILEEGYDQLILLGGGLTLGASHEITRLTGLSTQTQTFYSPNNMGIVRFMSDSSVVDGGFSLTYNAVSAGLLERNYLTATDNANSIFSIMYDDHQLGNQDNTYVITAENQIGPVTLEIVALDLAEDSQILIRDGDMAFHDQLAVLRGKDKERSFIVSSGKHMYITMQSIRGRQGGGFVLKYWQGCDITLRQSRGYLFSPGYPVSNYPNHAKCRYTIEVPESKPITYSVLDMNIYSSDTLKLYAPGAVAKELTGDKTQDIVGLIPGGTFIVELDSKFVGVGRGFSLTFSTHCTALDHNNDLSFIDSVKYPMLPNNAYLNSYRVICDNGATFVQLEHLSKDEVLLECDAEGWNVRTTPRCEKNYCPLAPSVPNGYVLKVNGGLSFGGVITYKCQPGFTLKGPTDVMCSIQKTWTQVPRCESTDCGPSGVITDGTKNVVGDDGTFGSIANYECNPGYDLIGSPTLHCASDGWKGTFPTCKKLTCFAKDIPNSILTPGNIVEVGQFITVSCSLGYELTPTTEGNKMTCQPDRTYDKTFTCENKDECESGEHTCDHLCHDTVGGYDCSCRPGYSKNGNACDNIVECTEDNGNCEHYCDDLEGYYTCTCNDGFVLFETNGQEGYSIPDGESGLLAGDKYHLEHSCVPKQCQLPTVENADLLTKKEQYHFRDAVQYQCHIGYRSGGHDVVTQTCGSSGTWVGPAVDCQLMTCAIPRPSNLLNPGTINTNDNFIDFRRSILITCERPGFIQETFTRARVCTLIEGQYMLDGSDEDHECGFVDCGQPKFQADTKFSDITTTYYGDTFTFSCQSSLSEIKGQSTEYLNATVTCLGTGVWDFGDLSCPSIRCEDPGQPKHGAQAPNVDYGDNQLVSFICNPEGYELNDPYPMSCIVDSNGNANYNASRPDCVDVQKPEITNCPTSPIIVQAFSSVGNFFPSISYKDNGGIKSVVVEPAWPNEEVYITSGKQEYKFIISDHAGNSDDCTIFIEAQDTTAPTFDCPVTRQIIHFNEIKNITFFKNELSQLKDDVSSLEAITVEYSPSFFTFEPANMRSHAFPPVYDQMISVSVSDEAGNKASCEFGLHFQADVCLPDYVREPTNSAKVCTKSGNGYSCVITCKDGYKRYDAPNENSVTLSCSGPGSPFPSTAVKCVRIDDAFLGYYKLSYEYRYESEVGEFVTDCDYKPSLQAIFDNNNDLGAEICTIPWTAKVEKVVNADSRSVIATLTINYERKVGNNYDACVQLQGVILNFPKTTFKTLLNIQSLDSCPSLTWKSSSESFKGYYCTHGSEVLFPVNQIGYCLVCPEGTYKGEDECKPCEIGEFNYRENQVSCEKCGLLTSTYKKGAVSNAECYGLCNSGTYSASGLPPCNNCPKNTYWSSATTCTLCGGDKITRHVGSQSISLCLSKCPAGFFNPVDGYGSVGVDCLPCPKHQFSSMEGATFCQECAADKYTASTLSKLESDCLRLNESNACSQTCQHGNCKNEISHVLSCVCDDGWTGKQCDIRLDPCDSFPCLNHGACSRNGDGYSCSCTGQAKGLNCETINPSCTKNSCQHNGMCENTVLGAKCHCLPGYSGPQCAVTTDICSNNPCKHDGTCNSFNNIRFTCTCKTGYTGALCEKNFDDCYYQPCRNNGTCIDNLNSLSCDCLNSPGYSGSFCYQREDPCHQVACGLGECVPDYVNQDYTCVCNAGAVLEEKSCKVKDFCDPDPCHPGAQCNSQTKRCECSSLKTGSLCQHDKDDCADNLCQQGACVDLVGDYKCECVQGYTGTLCDKNINECASTNCDEDGTIQCLDGLGKSECLCHQGYTGALCQINIQECESNPCLHDAECKDLVNDYKCECPTGWEGKNCETQTSYCQNQRCDNGATCHDVFGDYFCRCLTNTYGENCEFKPDICQVTTPCLNKGECKTDGNGNVECSCPFGYTGDRCQYKDDYCKSNDLCKNGAECEPSLDSFKCQCKTGFDGLYCENDIDHCKDNSCPANAQCIDMVERAYCRCPLELDGIKCDKALDPNWDFLFHHSGENGHAYLPYPTKLKSSKFSVSLRLQFGKEGGKGTFLSVYTVPSNSLREKQEFLRFDETQLTLHINGSQVNLMHFDNYNDGRWHYIVINVDGENGQATFILDTVRSDPVTFTPTTFDFNIAPVLGCHINVNTDECSTESNFYGMLSRVSFYESTLDFRIVSTEGNENIDAVFQDAILLWGGYLYTAGVFRVAPSMAGNSCPFGFTNYPDCDQRKPGKNLVKPSGNCPETIIRVNEERLSRIAWSVPSFTGQPTVFKKSLQSGESFLWGKYFNIFEARNEDGNAALCLSYIYVQDETCTAPTTPPNGRVLSFEHGEAYSRAALTCNPGYAVSIPSPNIHTCGPTGDWNPMEPYRPYRISPCGGTAPAINDLDIEIDYEIPSIECDSVTEAFDRELIKTLRMIATEWTGVCSNSDCSDAEIRLNCAKGAKTLITAFIHLNSINMDVSQVSNPSSTYSIKSLFMSLILAEKDNLFNYGQYVVDAIPIHPRIRTSQECIPPKVLLQGECVDCGPGTYYDEDKKQCHFCIIGEYNPNSAKTACLECGNDLTTAQVGASSSGECKSVCEPGSYFNLDADKCKECERGFFQPKEGQFFCLPCSADTTTRDLGTVLEDSCANLCPIGHQIGAGQNTSCELCPIGTFRTDEPVCQKCSGNLVTSQPGGLTQDDCNVADNPSGTYRTGDMTTYKPCEIGYYQPEPHKSQCIYCGDDYLTEEVQSVDVNQCKFFCPAGEEKVKDEDECRECRLGTYRDGSKPFAPCDGCPGNFITLNFGSNSSLACSRYRCEAGSAPNEDNNQCIPCPKGEYQPQENQEKCISCEDDETTANEGSKEQGDCLTFCPSGKQRQSDGNCLECPRGTYKDNTEDLLGMCKPCPDDKYTTDGSGSTSNKNCTVLKCDYGTFGDYNDDECKPCAKGEYQDELYKDKCKPCDGSFFTKEEGSTSSLKCEYFCPSGEEKQDGNKCEKCERGFYKDNGIDKFMKCTACDDVDYITELKGSISKSACTYPNCSAGYFVDGNKCSKCERNFFQNEKWKTNCLPCGENKITEIEGATSESECFLVCPEGKENPTGTNTCKDCERGYYKDTNDASQCKPCGDLNANNIMISPNEGATSKTECTKLACSPGYYPSGASCKMCEYGTFQSTKWSDTCNDCDDGKTTYVLGASSSDQCWLDCSTGEGYNTEVKQCEPCPIGFFNDDSDPSSYNCSECHDKFITLNQGSTSATDCVVVDCSEPGTYLFEAENKCQDCPKGTFQSNPRQKKCQDCLSGYTTKHTKSGSEADCKLDCDAGTEYNETSGNCEECGIKFYRSKDTWDCQPCPDSLTTPGARSTSSNDCSISKCKTGHSYMGDDCVQCPMHTYQNIPGMIGNCKPCPDGKKTTAAGQNSMDACKTPCEIGVVCSNANETCVFDSSASSGYRCECSGEYVETNANECIHTCDNNYCGTKGVCLRTPLRCECTGDYYGDRCDKRPNAESLSAQIEKDTLIGVVAGAGFLLFLILIIVALCLRSKRKDQKRRAANYDDRESIATKSDYPHFGGMKPSSSIKAPASIVSNGSHYNPYGGHDPTVYTA